MPCLRRTPFSRTYRGEWIAGCLGCGWRWNGAEWETHAPDRAIEPDGSDGSDGGGDDNGWDGGINSALTPEGDNWATSKLDGAPAEDAIPSWDGQLSLFDGSEKWEIARVLS